jgi:hypothetical protein
MLMLLANPAASQSQAPAEPNAAPPPAAQTPVTVDPGSMPQALPDSQRPDSLAAQRAPTRADTTLIVKHRFNHRQQIIAGSAIMASLAMVMVVMNNYNPRGFEE